MKIKLIILITLLITSINFLLAQENFINIYPNPLHESNTSVVAVEDGKFITCGLIYDEGYQNAEGIITLFDKYGNIEKSIKNNNVRYYSMIKDTLSDSFIISGTKDTIINNENKSLFVFQKYNSQLVVLNTWVIHSLHSNQKGYPQGYFIHNDSLLFFNVIFGDNNSNQLSSIYKYNLLTNQTSFKDITSPTSGTFSFVPDIVNIKSKQQFKVNINPPYNIIGNYDYNLNLVSIETIENNFRFPNRISYYNDTSYLLITSYKPNGWPGQGRNLSVSKYDINDIFQKQIILPSSLDTINNHGGGKCLLVTQDAIWAVGIYNMQPLPFPCMFEPTWVSLNKISHDFEIIAQYFYGGDGVYIPYGIDETSDKNIVVIGEYTTPATVNCNIDPFVMKVNKDGNFTNVNNENGSLFQEAIVYPNPGKDFIDIKLAVQHKNATFQLFDMSGKNVISKQINEETQSVNTSFLNSGTYIYVISSNDKIISRGKWIKAQ